MTSVVLAAGRLRVLHGGVVPELDVGGRVTALATRDGAEWLAVVDRRSVVRATSDAGWEMLADDQDAGITCLLVTDARVLAGTEGAHLLRIEAGALERMASFERAPGRADWYTPWGGPPAVRTLSEAADGTLYVNVHVGGIVRSRDGGTTWEPTIDIHTDVHQVLAHQPSGLLLAACGVGGLATSADGGDSWSIDTEGLHGRYCRAVAVSGRTVLVSASTGPRGGRAALYRRNVSGGRFERCVTGLPEWFDGNIDTGWLSATGRRCLCAAPDGSLYESLDEGVTWTVAMRGLRDVGAVVTSADDA